MAKFDAIRTGRRMPDFESFTYQVFGCDRVSAPWHTEPEWTGFYSVLGCTWCTCIHHRDQYLEANPDTDVARMLGRFDRNYRADEIRRRNDPDVHTMQPALF